MSSGQKKKEEPFCGFAVTPRVSVGTRIRKFFPGHGTYVGSVTSFDGELYEICYTDGDMEVMDASGFDHVEILQSSESNPSKPLPQHKRPSRHRKPSPQTKNGAENDGSSPPRQLTPQIPTCPICTEEFSGDPASKAHADHLPVQAKNCAHVVCRSCVEQMRLTTSFSGSHKRMRACVDCPLCKTAKSFHADNPTVCLTMCDMVQLCTNLQKDLNTKPAATVNVLFDEANREDATSTGNRDPKRKHRTHSREEHLPGSRPRKQAKENKEQAPEAVPSGEPQRCFQAQQTPNKATDVQPQPEAVLSSCISKAAPKQEYLACSCCEKAKKREKFSTKQWGRGVQQHKKALCRRCEEKAILRRELSGSGSEKFCTTLHVARRHGSKSKFLSTVVPWPLPSAGKKERDLPRELTLDGYSQEEWSLASNGSDGTWNCVYLRCVGDKMSGFLSFLRENKKSAYGTYLLPGGVDGFFVVPFDQPPPPKIEGKEGVDRNHLVLCKYVLGLGLQGYSEGNSVKDGTVSEAQEDYVSTSFLGKLLSGKHKMQHALAAVSKEEVKSSLQSQKQSLWGHRLPPSRASGQDWFRPCTMEVQLSANDKEP